jgi:hypothetical protein
MNFTVYQMTPAPAPQPVSVPSRLPGVLLACLAAVSALARAEAPDPLKTLGDSLRELSSGKLSIRGEIRVRPEYRTGVAFGRDPDLETVYIRNRFGVDYRPVSWLKISGVAHDARAPYYGSGAPNTARDSIDLEEGLIEILGDRKTGFGAVLGRQTPRYGEGRLIGVPDWLNVVRGFDGARVFYRFKTARIEGLWLSPVKVRTDEFNKPVMGERIWGVYSSFTSLLPGGVLDAYILRHDQNRQGGFTGAGALGTNTFGARAAGPLAGGFKYSVEGALQSGHTGALAHRGTAWHSALTRTVSAGAPLDLSAEYRYASGNSGSSAQRETTFDQLQPTNHDKFGRADLFGWKNIQYLRTWETFHAAKRTTLNVIFGGVWLADSHDGLYSGQGRVIARVARGDAGRHVGEELDFFATHDWGPFRFGGGFSQFFRGEFVRKATPGVNNRYLYVFQNYVF